MWKSVGGVGGIGSGKAAIWKALAGQNPTCTSILWCGFGGCSSIKGGNQQLQTSMTGSAQVDGSGNLYLRIVVNDPYNGRYFDSGWTSSQNGKYSAYIQNFPGADCNADQCAIAHVETTPTEGVTAGFDAYNCSVNWN